MDPIKVYLLIMLGYATLYAITKFDKNSLQIAGVVNVEFQTDKQGAGLATIIIRYAPFVGIVVLAVLICTFL